MQRNIIGGSVNLDNKDLNWLNYVGYAVTIITPHKLSHKNIKDRSLVIIDNKSENVNNKSNKSENIKKYESIYDGNLPILYDVDPRGHTYSYAYWKRQWVYPKVTPFIDKYVPIDIGYNPFNPALVIKTYNHIHVIRDDALPGGTKQRALYPYIHNIAITANKNGKYYDTFVYAGPSQGVAQVALGVVCKELKLSAHMFYVRDKNIKNNEIKVNSNSKANYKIRVNYKKDNKDKDNSKVNKDKDNSKVNKENNSSQNNLNKNEENSGLTELSRRAASYGVILHPCSYLLEAQTTAAEWCDNTGALLLPFGLDDDIFRRYLIRALRDVAGNIAPRRMWVIVGSGILLSCLYHVFPNTYFMAVQVGRKLWPDQYDMSRTRLFIAPEQFVDKANVMPPYPSVATYDAKLWQFVEKFGEKNDYIWNVA